MQMLAPQVAVPCGSLGRYGLAGGGVPLPVEFESFSPALLPAHSFCFLLVAEKTELPAPAIPP